MVLNPMSSTYILRHILYNIAVGGTDVEENGKIDRETDREIDLLHVSKNGLFQ